ncbi:MAG: helix-turn-helix domain-containing protein [Chloroflexi bacterium]|nr:helix-turn-helix domain-containing protein [Chloroflexota bacterium]
MSVKPVIEPNAIYSREETAHLLGISLTTLKQLIRAGHLVVSQPLGLRRVFIKGASILEMMDRTAVPMARGALNLVDEPRTGIPSLRVTPLAPQSQTVWHSNNLALRVERGTSARRAIGAGNGNKISRGRDGASR